MAEYGDLLQDDRFPDSARLTGGVLSALANAALRRYHGVELGQCDIDSVVDVLVALGESTCVPNEIRNHASDTRGAFLAEAGRE